MIARVLAVFRLLVASPEQTRPAPHPPRVRSRRSSARFAVWTGAAAGAVCAIGLATSLEASPALRDPEFGHRLNQLRDWKEKAPGRPLVAVFGSSRAQMGVSPKAMSLPDGPTDPLVYNLGLMGATPTGIRFQVFRTLDAGVRPDFVLAELFVANVGVDVPAEKQQWARATRLSAADLGLLAADMADPAVLPRRWAVARATAWTAHRLPLMGNWLPRWIQLLPAEQFLWTKMDDRGYAPYPHESIHPKAREKQTAQARQNHRRALDDFRVRERPDRAFREIVGRCRAEGIPVAFFRTPESPAFRTWYGPGSREKAEAYVAGLARELGVAIFPAPDLPEEAFADGHHLFPKPAAGYSRWLAETHVKPWLAAHGAGR